MKNNENEIGKLIKLVVIVTLIFGLFYLITVLINKEDKEEESTYTPAQIQYDKILISNILKQNEDKYYVLIYDTDDVNQTTYTAYLINYKYKEDAIRYYTAELNNPLNSKYVSSESNLKVKKIEDFKVKEATLLKVEKGKITKFYEGEEVLNQLIELTK